MFGIFQNYDDSYKHHTFGVLREFKYRLYFYNTGLHALHLGMVDHTKKRNYISPLQT